MIGFQRAAAGLATGAMFLLGGCVSAQDYQGVSEAMKYSPQLVEERTQACMKDYHPAADERRMMLALMKMKPDTDLPRALCGRLMSAIASGKMTYEDLQAMRSGRPTPKVVQILQGR